MSRQPGPEFLEACAFVCVDIQEGERHDVTEIPREWEEAGYTVVDCQAAVDHLHDVAIPAAREVADAFRALGKPVIFIHWGWRLPGALDLEPRIRRSLVASKGADATGWPHHIDSPGARPAEALGIREGELVIAKTGQDAFPSSPLGFALENLGVERIVFAGGHANPGGCLYQTVASARAKGYETLGVVDATYDAGESTRMMGLKEAGFDYLVSLDTFLGLAAEAGQDTEE